MRVTLHGEQVEGVEPEGVDVAVVALQETRGGFQRRFPIPGAHLHLGLLRDSRRERRVRDRHLVERVQRGGNLPAALHHLDPAHQGLQVSLAFVGVEDFVEPSLRLLRPLAIAVGGSARGWRRAEAEVVVVVLTRRLGRELDPAEQGLGVEGVAPRHAERAFSHPFGAPRVGPARERVEVGAGEQRALVGVALLAMHPVLQSIHALLVHDPRHLVRVDARRDARQGDLAALHQRLQLRDGLRVGTLEDQPERAPERERGVPRP